MIDNTLKQQAMAFFADIIDKEVQKTDEETNFELIDDCSQMLLLLAKDDIAISKAELQERITRITGTPRKKTHRIKITPRRIPTRIAAVLCVISLLVFSVGAVCIFDENLRTNLLSLFGKEIGTTVTINSVEYINGGVAKVYDSIEDLLLDNDLKFRYPKNINDSLTLEQVVFTRDMITLLYHDMYCSIVIYGKDDPRIDGLEENAMIYKMNGQQFFVRQIAGKWIALLYDDAFAYYISCDSEEKLNLIMNSFD